MEKRRQSRVGKEHDSGQKERSFEEYDTDTITDIQSRIGNNGKRNRSRKSETPFVSLPNEILMQILAHAPDTSFSLLLTHSSFYYASITTLYRHPYLDSSSFPIFSHCITRPNGKLVRDLDLSMVIHSSRPSLLAKILHRCASSLRFFAAPQAAFPLLPLRIIATCSNMTELDLSQICSVVDLPELCDAISSLPKLTSLHFPRSSVKCDKPPQWPPNLESLSLAGGINDAFILSTSFPKLRYLAIQHAPSLTELGLMTMLSRHGGNLHTVKILYPLPSFSPTAIDLILPLIPRVISLRFSLDYASRTLFLYESSIKKIVIDSSGSMGTSRKLFPEDFVHAMKRSNGLPALKIVTVHARVGWTEDQTLGLGSICHERGGELRLLNR